MYSNVSSIEIKLAPYLPEGTVAIIADWIREDLVKVKVTKSRSSKHGDYASPRNGVGHLITINHDLNKYEFLITLIHEFAHLKAYKKYRSFFRSRQINPHGVEWKNEYKELMKSFLHTHVFPQSLLDVLQKYIDNPLASSCSDLNLQRELKKFDVDQAELLEDLPDESIFTLKDGRVFKKLKKLRKNFRCLEMNTGRIYFVSPVAEVSVVSNVFSLQVSS